MSERVNEQVGATPVETTDRGLFDFKKKDEVAKPIKEEPEKKGCLDKIKEKLPGQNKTDGHHHEAVPVVAKPVVEGEEDKKGFLDKIKDKIPGLSSPKTGDGKNDHVDK